MAKVEIKITGIDDVLASLKALPPEIVSKRGGPVRKALRKAAVVIQKEAKLNIRKIVAEANKDGRPSESTGALEKSVIVTRGKYLGGVKGEKYLVWLGSTRRKYANTKANVRKGREGKEYDVELPNFYGRLLEYGTSKMRPHPWMKPAAIAKGQQAIDTATRELVNEINKIKKKLGFK